MFANMDVTSVWTWWRSTQMVKQTSGPLKPNAGLLMTALIEGKDPGEPLGSSGALQIVDPTVAVCESAEAIAWKSHQHVWTKMAVFGRALQIQIQILILILLKDNRSKLYEMFKQVWDESFRRLWQIWRLSHLHATTSTHSPPTPQVVYPLLFPANTNHSQIIVLSV